MGPFELAGRLLDTVISCISPKCSTLSMQCLIMAYFRRIMSFVSFLSSPKLHFVPAVVRSATCPNLTNGHQVSSWMCRAVHVSVWVGLWNWSLPAATVVCCALKRFQEDLVVVREHSPNVSFYLNLQGYFKITHIFQCSMSFCMERVLVSWCRYHLEVMLLDVVNIGRYYLLREPALLNMLWRIGFWRLQYLAFLFRCHFNCSQFTFINQPVTVLPT